MLEFFKDILIVFGRIITIIPLLLFATLFMGKRAIAELPVFDLLILIILGALVGADIADPEINHLPTAFAIISIAIFQRIVANLKISHRIFGRFITFEPTIVVQNGKFVDKNLRKVRYSIDNILQMLREKDIFDLREVETAIIEANGSLSVLKKIQHHTVTLADMNITKTSSTLTVPVIMEGKIYSDVLKEFHVNEDWLLKQLSDLGVEDVNQVFFASINYDLKLHISLKNESNRNLPPILH